MVNTSLNGLHAQGFSLILGQIFLELAVEDTHGGQTAGAKRQIWRSEAVAVRSNLNQLRATYVDSTANEVGSDVAAVAEDVLDQS